jgi:DNA-binding NtrC family response regulator
VDDEPNMGRIMVRLLEADGASAVAYADPGEALDAIGRQLPDVVLTDLKMPQMPGTDLLRAVKEIRETIEVIVMTAYGTIENAIQALKAGAYDYVLKPFNTDELLLTIHKAAERKRLREANMSLTEQLAARTIHRLSPRAGRRFVAINCGSIPETLLESELFGHEKGSFTGADRQKPGKLEWADGGTLFLDEIGELPMNLQVKLLRSLQEKTITRVGGLDEIPVDIRLLAATNRDLMKSIRNSTFRQDLYYRLNVIRVELPPLRRRQEDIAELAEHFIAKHAAQLNRIPPRLTNAARHALEIYRWPGNVRELENVIERTLVLLEGTEIRPEDLPADIIQPTPVEHTPTPGGFTVNAEYRVAKDHFERIYFAALLSRTRGSVAEAARQSQMSRRNLYEKIDRLGLDINQFKR